MKYWTGVGSRGVTPEIAELQYNIGARMAQLGYTLLSGGAKGSDMNFHKGVCSVDATKAVIYLPWSGFNSELISQIPNYALSCYVVPDKLQISVARNYYLMTGIIPWFDKMRKQGSQEFHGRNYYQVFHNETTEAPPPSKVCIYAAPETHKGEVSGGTRSAVMIARQERIPTYNLTIPAQRSKLLSKLNLEEVSNNG